MSIRFLWKHTDRHKQVDRRLLRHRKRAVVAAQVAIVLVVLLGMAALTIDVGALYNARADLQATADAAALASASMLSQYGEDHSPSELAEAAAVRYVEGNPVFADAMTIDPNTDISFWRVYYDPEAEDYEFTEVDPEVTAADAVKIRVRRTDDSPNGAVPLFFARILGIDEMEMAAEATAVMVPRDIAVVADLSGSHNDDSEFRHYKITDINIHEVWDYFPGGQGDIGGCWDPEDIPPEWLDEFGVASQAAGPAWGYMKKMGFGTEAITAEYDPTADTGLVELSRSEDWSNAQLEQYLRDLGYIPSEVDALMNGWKDDDSSYPAWPYRPAMALGLAYWNSGHPPDPDTGELAFWAKRGVDPRDTGNGNDWICKDETQWVETFGDRTVSQSKTVWMQYINSYMNKTNTRLYKVNNDFRYRFGAKTFINFLMEKRMYHNKTPEFAGVPAQPMQAVKEAVSVMMDIIVDLDTDDMVSLEIYGTTGRHELDLSRDYTAISDRLNDMQAAHYDNCTCMGAGLERAIEELNSTRARGASRKMIILLTDGKANVGKGGLGAAGYALQQAEIAADQGFKIFCVSVGANSDQGLMQQIADIGHGEHFHAEGSIDQYSDDLAEIFRQLGGKRPVELIE